MELVVNVRLYVVGAMIASILLFSTEYVKASEVENEIFSEKAVLRYSQPSFSDSAKFSGDIQKVIAKDLATVLLNISIAFKISYIQLAKAVWEVGRYYGKSWTFSRVGMRALGWEIGRMLAIRDGYPDPGPWFAPNNIGGIMPFYAEWGYNILRQNL